MPSGGTVNLRSCGRFANHISLIRHTRPGESRRRTGENRPRIAKLTVPTMLLSVTRRKTGKTQTVPVIYIEDGGRYVVAAAYSGSDTDPSWWLNLQANPVAVVQVMGEAKEVQAVGGRRRAAEPVAAVGSDVSVLRRVSATYAPRDTCGHVDPRHHIVSRSATAMHRSRPPTIATPPTSTTSRHAQEIPHRRIAIITPLRRNESAFHLVGDRRALRG